MPSGKPLYRFDRLQLGQQIEMLFVTPAGYRRRRHAAYMYAYARGWVIRFRLASPSKLIIRRLS